MKVGFCLHRNWLGEKPELVKLLDELGYDGVEIWQQAFEILGLEGVREALKPYRLEVAAINPYFDFTTSDTSYRDSIELAKKFIEYARALDCIRIRVYTSKMGSFKSSDEAQPIHWLRAINGIRTVCDIAAEYGIMCLMEVHYGDGQLYDSSPSTLRILKAVDRSNLAVNLQPPLKGETPYESAERLGPYVKHLHIHNWIGRWGNFTFLDSGDLDIPRFVKILRKYGFDGYMSIEHATWRSTEEIARHEVKYLKNLIKTIEDV